MRGEQRLGDWRVVCDYSGFDCWASETVKTWDGYRVHRRFVGEEQRRHPQEAPTRLPRGEGQVPWTRPVAEPTFIAAGSVTAADL